MRRDHTHAQVGTAALVCCVLAFLAAPGSAAARTIAVTTIADASNADEACSLREAVDAANGDIATGGCPAGEGADEITLGAFTYSLELPGNADADANAGGDLDLTSAITIRGVGAAVTSIDGTLIDRVLDVATGAIVTVQDVTITRGRARAGTDGLSDQAGNGLDNFGTSGGPGAAGGGIRSAGTLTVTSSTISGNAAGNGGDGGDSHAFGGFLGSGGGNASGGSGGSGGAGGAVASSGALTITNSRIIGNSAGSGGDGGDAIAGSGAAGSSGAGGNGGSASSGSGAIGGSGGGISASGSAPVVITGTVIRSNTTGAGGSGGVATAGNGGNGGSGPGSTPGGAAGGAFADFNGAGGSGGGISTSAPLTLTDATVAENTGSNGGSGGASTGGTGGVHGGGGGADGAHGVAFGGFGGTGGHAGGMRNVAATTIERVTFAGNVAGNGGPAGTATGGGTAAGTGTNGGDAGEGGALDVLADTTLTNVTLDANRAGAGGPGGVGSTSGGRGGTGGRGGAFHVIAGEVSITAATITGNTFGPPGAGGAPAGPAGSAGTGGALRRSSGSVAMRQSIVSANQSPSCDVPTFTGEDNLHLPLDAGCPGIEGDPALGPLADNGGASATRTPAPDSPVVDRFACSGTDQRGVARPFGALCDIGAYERAAPSLGAGAASGVTSSAATLGADVNANARATTVSFDFGTTAAYGSSTAEQTLPAAVASRATSAAITGLAPATSYHFRVRATNADGTSVGQDQTFTTAAAPAPAPGDTTPPTLSKLSAAPRTFAVAKGRTAIASAKKQRVPLGTRLRFTLSEPAGVKISLARASSGRKVANAGRTTCVAAKRRPTRKAQRCTRFVAVGSLSRSGRRAGANAVAFSGRLGSKALARGTYRFSVTATDAAGNRSRAATATFVIVRPTTRR